MKVRLSRLALAATAFLACPTYAQEPASPPPAEPPASLVKYVADPTPDTKAQIAARNVYALNTEMMGVYKNALAIFKQNFLQKSNLIMGLFTGKGGRFILYRAGQPPIEAPTPPLYELGKSIGHAPMAVYEILAPYSLDPKANTAWQAPLRSFCTRITNALETLGDLDVKPEDRQLFKTTLEKLLGFSQKALKDGTYTYAALQDFCRDMETEEGGLTMMCSRVQVEHWCKVLDEWKALLGDDWDNTYGLTNSIYVTRQNNILFSVMAQYFGEEAINERLMMIETTNFQTTPEEVMEVFCHTIADRTLSTVFFNTDRIMDTELLGWDGRKFLAEEMKKRGKTAVLPPLVPLNSNEWPWRTDPSKGSGPKSFDDLRAAGTITKFFHIPGATKYVPGEGTKPDPSKPAEAKPDAPNPAPSN